MVKKVTPASIAADRKYEATTKKENFAKVTISKKQKEWLDTMKEQHETTLIGVLDLLIDNYTKSSES